MAFMISCGEKGGSGSVTEGAPRGDESLGDIVKRRGLNSQDVLAAVKEHIHRTN